MIIDSPGRYALETVESRVVTYDTTYFDGTKDYHAYNINQVLRAYVNAKKVEITYINGYKAIIAYFPMNSVSVKIFKGNVYVQEQPNGLMWSTLGNGEYYQSKDGPIRPSIMRGPNRMNKDLDYTGNKQDVASKLITEHLDTYQKEYMPEYLSLDISSLWDNI